MDNYKNIWSLIPKSYFSTFIIMCLFSSFIAFVELIGVAAIIPLVSLLSEPDYITNSKFHSYVYEVFGVIDKTTYIYYLASLTLVFFVARAFLNFQFVSKVSRFSFDIFQFYQFKLLSSFVNASYIHYVNKMRMGDYLKVMTKEIGSLSVVVSSFMTILSEVVVFTSILCVLLYIDYVITLSVIFLISVVGLINLQLISKKILAEGVVREKLEGDIYSTLKEIFTGFKLIKLLPAKDNIENILKEKVVGFSNSNVRNQKLQNVPRITMETSAFLVVIIIVVIFGVDAAGNTEKIATISFFLLALFRMLPSINRIISSHHIIVYSLPAIDVVNKQINIPSERNNIECYRFNKDITFENVNFSYGKDNVVFDNVNFTISRGDKIVISGPSGCGKTTLVDLIIGLIKPSNGNIYVDGVDVTSRESHICNEDIGYLDQNIYIANDSVANNISLGRARDDRLVLDAMKLSSLTGLGSDRHSLDYKLGESGAKLSGGQRQRIAIARTLYTDANLLIFDEPTSSLDDKTAFSFVENVFLSNEEKTVIVIDHRGHFTNHANKIMTINNESVVLKEI